MMMQKRDKRHAGTIIQGFLPSANLRAFHFHILPFFTNPKELTHSLSLSLSQAYQSPPY